MGIIKTFMNDDAFLKKGFNISTDKSLLDFEVIYNFLSQESYWAKGISKERLAKAIQHSICYGLYHEQKQIGFARLITDESTFAYVADVFVLPAYRKQGLSKWLVQTIINHDDFKGIKRWLLATLDAHGLYQQFGFEPLKSADRFLEILTPYQNN
ncbi:GNAT family N-acetyltransferase [Pedobacter glucosidilyticus]|uniref:GNAT family N-acetyltransferase n=1 Tax=Pedobacter glucosidilyticus TaxID=1122941 RepID=UPI0012DC150B|nr:GNAT family N-acetyltransferase [Pedobacter glucosidilyticus]